MKKSTGSIGKSTPIKYVWTDSADFVQCLKLKIGERGDYLKERQEYKAQGLDWDKSTKVLPLYFGTKNKIMLTHAKTLVDNGLVAIHPKFDKLITGLRTASENQGVIDKERTSIMIF